MSAASSSPPAPFPEDGAPPHIPYDFCADPGRFAAVVVTAAPPATNLALAELAVGVAALPPKTNAPPGDSADAAADEEGAVVDEDAPNVKGAAPAAGAEEVEACRGGVAATADRAADGVWATGVAVAGAPFAVAVVFAADDTEPEGGPTGVADLDDPADSRVRGVLMRMAAAAVVAAAAGAATPSPNTSSSSSSSREEERSVAEVRGATPRPGGRGCCC
jgi:hypothetical protein